MTCEKCYHNEVCKALYELNGIPRIGATECAYFRDKDHLIETPVKAGQTVYVPWKWNGEKGIATIEVEEIRIYDSKNNYMFFIDMESDDEDYNQTYGGWKIGDGIGKTVFLTREAAEAALEARNAKP